MTHQRYSFYNPKQHPYWTREGGKVIYFEGTYTVAFSGNRNPTPRYDYNQILYRLNLSDLEPIDPADERLNLRDPAPAPAIGSDADGRRVLVVCSVGVDPRLVPAVAELVLRELPDRVLVVLPTRDVLAPVERAVARLRVPTTVVGVACSWDA